MSPEQVGVVRKIDWTTGDVAQLGERWLCKPQVTGSIPVISTIEKKTFVVLI